MTDSLPWEPGISSRLCSRDPPLSVVGTLIVQETVKDWNSSEFNDKVQTDFTPSSIGVLTFPVITLSTSPPSVARTSSRGHRRGTPSPPQWKQDVPPLSYDCRQLSTFVVTSDGVISPRLVPCLSSSLKGY